MQGVRPAYPVVLARNKPASVFSKNTWFKACYVSLKITGAIRF